MRINAVDVSPYQTYGKANQAKRSVKSNFKVQTQNLADDNIAFRGLLGKVGGGGIGAGLAGLCALASMATPVGWIAAATLLAAETGGAVVGGIIGDKIEGKDDN